MNGDMQLLSRELPTWLLDVHFRSRSRLIACAVLESDQGLILIDPGPSSTLPVLRNALESRGGLSAVKTVILTHIHLDHAGCVGQISEALPEAIIHVHPIGGRHLVNPERLIQSAHRIYGDRMEQLWGQILPVPEKQIHAVEDGSTLDIGGRRLRVCYTPGHASHHIAWLDDATNFAYVGDIAGMRIQGADHIIPVAPPPDINLLQWEQSLERLEAENPQKLFLTHFGMVDDVPAHISGVRRQLHAWADAVRSSLDDESVPDAIRADVFHASEMKKMQSRVEVPFQEPYNYMGQPRESWYGFARYWRKTIEQDCINGSSGS